MEQPHDQRSPPVIYKRQVLPSPGPPEHHTAGVIYEEEIGYKSNPLVLSSSFAVADQFTFKREGGKTTPYYNLQIS